MQANQSFHIRASKPETYAYIALSVCFGILNCWLLYQIILGNDLWIGFLLILFMTLLFSWHALSMITATLQLNNGQLTIKSFFIKKSIRLGSLSKAEKLTSLGKSPTIILRLEDTDGNVLQILPAMYSMKELETIIESLRPYIFLDKVQKNFIDLDFND